MDTYAIRVRIVSSRSTTPAIDRLIYVQRVPARGESILLPDDERLVVHDVWLYAARVSDGGKIDVPATPVVIVVRPGPCGEYSPAYRKWCTAERDHLGPHSWET